MIEREQLREKQDEADALRKALEHEKQSHLETCSRENTTREQLAMERILKDAARKAFNEVCTTCDELRSQNAALREIAEELTAALKPITEHGGEVSFIPWKHITDARTALAKVAGILLLAKSDRS